MQNNIKKWYMITTISQREEKVIESLKNRVQSENMQDLFEDFKVMMVPHITPGELAKKNKGLNYKTRQKNLFPGYIFLKMVMSDEAWFMIRNTQYVTGLVGSSGARTKPTPISNIEMKRMEKRVSDIIENFKKGVIIAPFKVGDSVEIIEGPAKGQVGPIVNISNENQVATVEVILFERKTETVIPFKHISTSHR